MPTSISSEVLSLFGAIGNVWASEMISAMNDPSASRSSVLRIEFWGLVCWGIHYISITMLKKKILTCSLCSLDVRERNAVFFDVVPIDVGLIARHVNSLRIGTFDHAPLYGRESGRKYCKKLKKLHGVFELSGGR